MSTMRVIQISEPGGPEVLHVGQRERPRPAANEVVIRVHAAGINRPDLMQRAGKYPPPPDASDLPGLEVAGEIAELGSDVGDWRVGDAVCALCNGGGYAEYVATPAGQCLPRPAGLDWVQAAALPETFFTVWTNVFQRGRLRAGESLLVHGGSSGIGTTAIQLARAFGADVFATAGSDEKVAACQRLGAHGINYRTQDFVAAIADATASRGVDVILDMIGGDYFARNLEALAVAGRLVQIATQHGGKVELELPTIMRKRLTLTGSTLRPLDAAAKTVIASELRAQVWPKIEAGDIRPLIHARIPFTRAAEAHRLLEGGDHIGKVVLDLDTAASDDSAWPATVSRTTHGSDCQR